MNLLSFSIVSGWFPFVLFWVTVSVCVMAVILRRDVLMEFAIGVPLGIVFVGGLWLALHFGDSIPPGAPRSLYLWLTGACLLGGLVVAGWHHARWPRRVTGVAAILLAVVSAGSAVNQTFQYYPTLDRLLGKTANHFINNSQLSAIREQVARTGRLPDHGATLTVSIPGVGLKYQPHDAYVWVPPAWFAPNHPQLPVIELLNGTPGAPSDWTRAIYADATSLGFAEQHNGVAPVLVMPDVNGSFTGDTECVNSTMYGDVENYLTRDVPQFMQKNFNTRTSPGSIAVAGLSEGGMCAAMIALNNPKEYPTFAVYSGLTSPTYQEDNAQQTIARSLGGPWPTTTPIIRSICSNTSASPGWRVGLRQARRTAWRWSRPARSKHWRHGRESIPVLLIRPAVTTTASGSSPSQTLSRGSPGSCTSLQSHKTFLLTASLRARDGRTTMPAAVLFAILPALSNACSAVLQRLAVIDEATGATRSLWKRPET